MDQWTMNQRRVRMFRGAHPPGTRIELLSTTETMNPVPIGTRGTVVHVDDQCQIHMKWDNGRTLAIIPGEDNFRKLTKQEIAEEQGAVEYGDECKIILPEEMVDCSTIGFFDHMENKCWDLVKDYCNLLGVEMLEGADGEIPVSYDIAKGIQDHILETLQEAGVKMYFGYPEDEVLENTTQTM